VGPVEGALRELATAGRVLEGEFRPRGSGREWCDSRVLATLRRRSLARLRKQVEPAEPAALARLLLDWQGLAHITQEAPARRGADALLAVIESLQGAGFPASALEADLLPARLPSYRPEDLDALCAAGELVWVGMAPLGGHDGRIALYLSDDLDLLHPPSEEEQTAKLHGRIREHLVQAGASFFAEIHAAAGGGLVRPVLDALWDLVWAGEVTNDTFTPLRAFLSGRRSQRRASRRLAAFRSRRAAPASAGGRWSLVARLRSPSPPSPTERLTALAGQLLARHGVLTRAAVASEGIAGGFAALYPVLSALEEQGRVRRGYFLAGLGGSQFAEPGALDRLRAVREADADAAPTSAVLAASDPAQPYGAALAWPESGTRLARAAGAHVVLVDGQLTAYLSREARDITLFLPDDEPVRSRIGRGAARALAAWAQRTARSRLGWGAAAAPLMRGPLASFLEEAGFEASGPGVRLRFGGDAAEG
jgi:ATP-dependent Lhr-like helicase